MNEVNAQTALLLLDTLEQRGVDRPAIWDGLPVDRDSLRSRAQRMDWETWVALMARVEQHVAMPLEELFVPGAGTRIGHPFAQIVSGLVSLKDMYSYFARWALRRGLMTVRARFEILGPSRARVVATIDPTRAGSLPTLRFMVGMLRGLPRMQGYGSARVRIVEGATDHRAEYAIELPQERPMIARARRLLGVIGGVSATLGELETQANEIATKNLELEAQLAETRERDKWLDVALHAGRIGLWRWDPSIRRVRVSSTLAEWLGVPGKTEIDTTVWGKLVHPDDQANISQVMADALEKHIPFETEYRVQLENGDITWFHITGRVETEPDGRVYAYGGTVDITEKKLMDSRLRLADRLIAAGTLAAGVAHEINNPLTYVVGSIDLIKRRLAKHPEARDITQDLLAQILDGVERIRSVVADVRAFARHDDNAVVPVDLHAVCAAAIRIVSTDIRHQATVITELAPDVPFVLANESRLGQVMINLIVNASQAMPPDRPSGQNRITIRTRRLATGGAVVEVEDNGTGIAPEIVPRVFDPFFTTKPVGVGTGLGLSVCQGIITGLGGRIDLTSTVGRGSRFTVTLQQAAASEPEAASTGSRVLVIDDEPMIRSVVARTLTAQGFSVDEATNGREGLERATGNDQYDAILCDLMMPDVDGVELHRELLTRRPDLVSRIVFISGGAVTARVQAFLQTPGVVVLHKPFAFDLLVDAIERAAHGTSTSLPLT